jgi:hypothetical protein
MAETKDIGAVMQALVNSLKAELDQIEQRANTVRGWVDNTENLLAMFAGDGAVVHAPDVETRREEIEAPRVPHAPQRTPSLRKALREMSPSFTEPTTVEQMTARLIAIGVEPRDADAVDSTMYNLKAIGVPLTKVAPRTWVYAEPVEAEAPKAESRRRSSKAA